MFPFDPAISSAVSSDTAPVRLPVTAVEGPLTPDVLERMQRYWQAANYLTIGQIYLQDNALLREPLRPEHIKPRLLGHWGTSPGLSFIYLHLNRLIQEHDVNAIYLAGPGHGGPALLANVYLEGTYSEVYPEITPDAAGIRLLRERAGLQDADAVQNRLTYPADKPEARIDYILSSPELSLSAVSPIETFASDHLPLVAEF